MKLSGFYIEREVYDQAQDGIIVIDADGIVRHLNRAFLRETEMEREKILGQELRALNIRPQKEDDYDRLWEVVASGQVWVGCFFLSRDGGRRQKFLCKATPLTSEEWVHENGDRLSVGRILRRGQVASDLHLFIRFCRVSEILEMQQNIQDTRENKMINQLFPGIAHEINTPMQSIRNNVIFMRDAFAELVKYLRDINLMIEKASLRCENPEVLEEIRRKLNDINENFYLSEFQPSLDDTVEGMNHVLEIVFAMRDFGRPDMKKKVSCDLDKIIQGALVLTRNKWKNLARVKTQFALDLASVNCHPCSLKQVLINLIVNSIAAIEKQYQGSSGARGEILIETERKGEVCEIRISDNGCGITDDVSEHLFDLFFTTKSPAEGTGQGLPLVKQIVEKLHQGAVFFKNRPQGQGVTFFIHIPLSENTNVEEKNKKRFSSAYSGESGPVIPPVKVVQ